MKLRFTPLAVQNIAGIAGYIREFNPTAAEHVRAAIIDALQTLVMFPQIGRLQTVSGVRKLVVRKYPYLVYYRIDEALGEINVLTILHPARNRNMDDL